MLQETKQKRGTSPQGRLLSRLGAFFISALFWAHFAPPLHADTLILHPSGKNALTNGWTFSPSGAAGEANNLDSNDGDTSVTNSTALNDKLYMDLDDTTLTGFVINDVQVFAVARITGSSTRIQVGFRAGPTDTADRLGSSQSVRSASYRSYSGNLHTTNPRTNATWTWSDINSLIPMVLHANDNNTLRVTELFVRVNYTKAISPSGKNALTAGWTFTGTEASALDTNDGDTSYAASAAANETLYVDLDDFPASTTTITGVRLSVVAKCTTLPCNLQVGIRTNGADFLKGFDEVPGAGTIYSIGATSIHGNATSFNTQLAAGSQITAMGQTRTVASVSDRNDLTVTSAFNPQLPNDDDLAVPFTFLGGTTSYQTFSGDFFTRNPATLAPWTWNDINNMMGVVKHVTNSNGLRVTQAYLSINYIAPVALSYSPDTGFGSTGGVFPKSGGAATPFTYKIVYTNLNKNAPTSIKVHIDGDGGHEMARDLAAEHPEFRDGDYENGEQYTYTAPSLSSGQHLYYFAASDGSDSTQKPAVGTLAGPGVSIPAGTDIIRPSGENPLTLGDWGFTGADASTALDDLLGPDGNATYADLNASNRGEVLYLDMENTALTGSIGSVQVSAVMCSPSSSLANVRIGLRLSGTDYLSVAFNVANSSSCGTYTTYTPASALYKINPDTGKGWTWDDLNEMVGVVLNENTNDLRITQFSVAVAHTPVILSFADDPGYDGNDGVHPDSGKSTTPFTYKVIYSNANGTAPAGNPKIHIDGNASGVAMDLDTGAADPTLYNGDYFDGEQYTYTAPAGYSTGTHNYYFSASDGSAGIVFPAAGNYSGPAVSLPAGSFTLFPTDVADGTSGFSFCTGSRRSDCFDPATALDTNDGDTSYARGRRSDDYLYMSMDDAKDNGQFITSVQVSAVVKSESGTINFTLGLSSADNLIEGSTLSTSSTSYVTLSGTPYGFNPLTGAPWTWVDIQNLVAVVHHTNSSRMRITQLYVVVSYGPVRLQNSSAAGYINDGVHPELGNTTTSFTFKTVYYQVNNVAPAANNPKIHLDGDATGAAMTLDPSAAPSLRDGDYANGEQYTRTATLSQGTHTYYFSAGDGSNTARLPAGTAAYSGPDVALNGAAPNLAPSDRVNSAIVGSTGWTFCNSSGSCNTNGGSGYTPAVALDTHDSDNSYARSTTNGNRLYMELDDPAALSDSLSILSIQLFAVARTPGSTTTGLDFGLRLGNDDYLSGTTKTPTDAYGAAIAGALYTTNPATGENWSWNDIKGMRAVVVHQTTSNEVRVTQLYLTVTYSPIRLTYSTDPRYFDDGVDPNGGTTATPFNYRIVYTQAYGLSPAAGYPKVHIDGDATGVGMTLDPDAPAALKDGDYTNGEQYLHTTTLGAQGAPHNYYFDVSDGTNVVRTPSSGTLLGPVVSADAPTLSFAGQTGYGPEAVVDHRGVQPNSGTVNLQFIYKVVYTDADNNPPLPGFPRLLLDYNTVVHAMSLDTGAAASLKDGNYTNGEQYTVTVYLDYPGTHAYAFDATDGVTAVVFPTDGDGFLAPSVTDSVSSGIVIYPASRNAQTSGFTFLGTDQDPSTALDAGYPGNGTLSNAVGSTTVTGSADANFTAMSAGSILTAGSPHQKRRVTAVANDTSLTTDTAFSPNLSGVPWRYDGDVSYARGTRNTHRLYMNMDDVSRGTTAITSVQLFAIIRDNGSNVSFSVGLQVGGTDYMTGYTTPGTATYTTYGGALHNTNPKTGAAWTWDDVENLLGVAKHLQSCTHSSGCREIRVTQMYIQVNYNSLPTLSFSPEGGYFGTDGVDPDGWNPDHIFTYKVVYASGSNFAPASLKVFIDGDAGHEMIHDGEFITNDPLRNGDYTDGEQFRYSTPVNGLSVGPHTYYFLVSDGSNTYRLPTSGSFSGPNVSANEPFLQFSSESGYGADGVDPNNGESGSTQFTYKVVYTHPDNNPPLYVKVHIDGTKEGALTVDSGAAAALRDGNHVNGEQYRYTTNLGIGSHTYLFEATDGAKQVFLPVVPSLGILSGPTVTDLVAPNAVTNLAVGARTPTSTTLTWTAPGDAGSGAGCPCGSVAAYNIRYSTLKIVDDAAVPGAGEIRFSDATSANASLTPKPAGATETFTATGLSPNTPYYFAMKSADAKPWTSPMSNVVNASSNPPIPSTNLLSSWNMVSVPMTPSPADVATVFGSSVGVPVNIRKWVSTGTTNQTGAFHTLAPTDAVEPGIGYFLESPDATRFLNPAGSANAAATFSIPLMQGYNIIGNPYTKDIALDAACVSRNGGSGICTPSVDDADFKSYGNAAAAGWVGNALYRWDGTAYTFRTYNDPDPALKATLRLWQGYWLLVTDPNGANTYRLIIVKP